MRRRSHYDFTERFLEQLLATFPARQTLWQRFTDWIRRLV